MKEDFSRFWLAMIIGILINIPIYLMYFWLRDNFIIGVPILIISYFSVIFWFNNYKYKEDIELEKINNLKFKKEDESRIEKKREWKRKLNREKLKKR